MAKVYQIDYQQGCVTLTFPLHKKLDLEHAYLPIKTNRPLSFSYELKDLLAFVPAPEIQYFLRAYWQALWQTIQYFCQYLLGQQANPVATSTIQSTRQMTNITHTRLMPLSSPVIIDKDDRRLQVSFSSQAPLQRQSALNTPWIEILGHEKEEIDLSRLNAGAAVLYNHDRHHPDYHLGIVEKAWIEDKRGQAIIRLSKRQAIDGLWQDIQDGIIKHVSVGYLINQRHLLPRSNDTANEEANDKAIDTYRITHWQPHEISLVTIPADSSVGIGRSEFINHNWDEQTMENKMNNQPKITSEIANADDLDKRSQDIQAIQTATLAAESSRRQRIRAIFTPHHDKQPLCERCLDDPNISLDGARKLLLDELGRDSLAVNINTHASITYDERDKVKAGMENALLFRAGLTKLEANNEFQSYKLAELARVSLAKAKDSHPYTSSMDLVGRAFTHSSSDFPAILANTAYKSMLKGYQEASETYQQWTSQGSLPDFKVNSRVDLTIFPSLKKVPEGTEYKYATLGERGETIQLASFGALFTITRQAIINDDLHLFTQIPRKMGQAAQRTIGALVYAILTDNPVMGDKHPLFSKAHGNVADKKSPFNVEALSQAQTAMATQQLDGATLNITPAFLIVPVALAGKAKVLMDSETDLDQPNARVPNAVRNLAQVIADPRLDLVSPTTWYLVANPNQFDVLEVAYLEGNSQPTLERQQGWQIDGVSYKVRLDAGVKALDYRTFYRGEIG